MARGFLPKVGTPDADAIIQAYPTASLEQLETWATHYGYASANSFETSLGS